MRSRAAAALIASAIDDRAGTWADIGAGEGVFTRALVELLEPGSRIYAVDNDATVLRELQQWATRAKANVIPVIADFTGPFELPALGNRPLDGMLIANALHFIRDAAGVLARLVDRVRPGARVVVVEYDRRRATQWVPYPIDIDRLPEIAAYAGLTPPTLTATQPSRYGGAIYVAAMDRLAPQSASVTSVSLGQKPSQEDSEREIG